MGDVQKRLAELGPAERRVLAELVTKRKAGASRATEALGFGNTGPGDAQGFKESYRRFYNEVSTQLNASVFGQFSFFLNYGYKPNGQPEYAAATLPEQYINRNSVKLVLEVIGDAPIDGKRVLDVGCGRGGTVHVLQTFFKPKTVQGLDLSPVAVEFCRKAHKRADTTFFEGDAEHLPFTSDSLDVVTNLESSHSYPHIESFYTEVHRVLSPGGYFLYTDAMALQRRSTNLAYLQHIGFEVERDRDITANVLLSCDEVATTRVGAFATNNDPGVIQNFLATPGSEVYGKMQTGAWMYFILKLRKRD